ncbi:hypothetical protein GDO81_018904 [Engystomops pustulosus]|uniref:Uncharacterized protein n=1 Tax=Engystomops pustulosus TaxID=76066 RepID=A0AAV6YTD8_ENGPU|nr:hypothetical protein GDO81_018904 [Engystomops pustulosus]
MPRNCCHGNKWEEGRERRRGRGMTKSTQCTRRSCSGDEMSCSPASIFLGRRRRGVRTQRIKAIPGLFLGMQGLWICRHMFH